MLSVNSNYGASVALQSLNGTNKELSQVQNRISTGFKVASARDNGAVYAIAEGQRARVSSVAAVKDGIDRASSTIDVALSAGKAVGDILQKLKAKAAAAQADDLSAEQRDVLQVDFSNLRLQIDTIANAAQFNGANLALGDTLSVLTSDLTGATPFAVQGADYSLAGSILSPLATLDISTSTTTAATASTAVDTAITALNESLATMGSQAGALDVQNDFLSKLSDVIEQGISNLVDADLAKESARLQSLQIKQQLGAQALSIANQTPQLLLSFFR
ncbi:MAG TPA: flagellin [Hyphomonadaceae bacterium]|jgi:flagellin|nr:flagellin [Hyphomonadaceae bacterium]HPN06790.1 flagellin [Hyphomonadaceae bacterium]